MSEGLLIFIALVLWGIWMRQPRTPDEWSDAEWDRHFERKARERGDIY
jgi:hypothetical protein